MKNLGTGYSNEVLALVNYLRDKYTKDQMDKVKAFSEEKLKLILTLISEESFEKIWEHVDNTEEVSYRKLMFYLRDQGLFNIEPQIVNHPTAGPLLVLSYSVWLQFLDQGFFLKKLLDVGTSNASLMPYVPYLVMTTDGYTLQERSVYILNKLLMAIGPTSGFKELVKEKDSVLYKWIELVQKKYTEKSLPVDFDIAYFNFRQVDSGICKFACQEDLVVKYRSSSPDYRTVVGSCGWSPTHGFVLSDIRGNNYNIPKEDLIPLKERVASYMLYNSVAIAGIGIFPEAILSMRNNFIRAEIAHSEVKGPIRNSSSLFRFIERGLDFLHQGKLEESFYVNRKTMTLISRSHIGGKDLFMGVPSLKDAVFEGSDSYEEDGDYCTSIKLRLKSGDLLDLIIKQEI